MAAAPDDPSDRGPAGAAPHGRLVGSPAPPDRLHQGML